MLQRNVPACACLVPKKKRNVFLVLLGTGGSQDESDGLSHLGSRREHGARARAPPWRGNCSPGVQTEIRCALALVRSREKFCGLFRVLFQIFN